MRAISKMVLINTFTIFLLALVFFVLIIQIIDLFANLTRYINQDVPFIQVISLQFLFLPKSMSYALPIALLFSIAFSMGTLYSNNELVAILGAGIPMIRLVTPLIFLGALLSIASFFFEDSVVIPANRLKEQRSRELLGISRSFSNADITLIGAQGRAIYFADYYNDATQSLTNILFVLRDSSGNFLSRIEGRNARWNGSSWEIPNAVVFVFDDSQTIAKMNHQLYTNPLLNTNPESFRRQTQNVDDLTLSEAAQHVANLQAAGLPFRAALTNYYERISFAFTPFVVTLLSCGIGGKLKKNILLLSLLLSLSISVGYYVMQMVLSLLAGAGGLPPFWGAFSSVLLFTFLGFFLLHRAKT